MDQLLELAIEGARFARFLLATEEEIDQDGQDQCFEHSFRVSVTSDSPVSGWGYVGVMEVILMFRVERVTGQAALVRVKCTVKSIE